VTNSERRVSIVYQSYLTIVCALYIHTIIMLFAAHDNDVNG